MPKKALESPAMRTTLVVLLVVSAFICLAVHRPWRHHWHPVKAWLDPASNDELVGEWQVVKVQSVQGTTNPLFNKKVEAISLAFRADRSVEVKFKLGDKDRLWSGQFTFLDPNIRFTHLTAATNSKVPLDDLAGHAALITPNQLLLTLQGGGILTLIRAGSNTGPLVREAYTDPTQLTKPATHGVAPPPNIKPGKIKFAKPDAKGIDQRFALPDEKPGASEEPPAKGDADENDNSDKTGPSGPDTGEESPKSDSAPNDEGTQ